MVLQGLQKYTKEKEMKPEKLTEEQRARIKMKREKVIEEMAKMPAPKNEKEAEFQNLLKIYSDFTLKVTDRILKEDNQKNGRK